MWNINFYRINECIESIIITNKSLRDLYKSSKTYIHYLTICLLEISCWSMIPNNDGYTFDGENTFDQPFFNNIVTKDMVKTFNEKFTVFFTIMNLLRKSVIFRQEVMMYYQNLGYACKWKKIEYTQKYNKTTICDFNGKDIDGTVFLPGFASLPHYNDNNVYPINSICDYCACGEMTHAVKSIPKCPYINDIKGVIKLQVLKIKPSISE